MNMIPNTIIILATAAVCLACENATGRIIGWMDTYLTNGLDGMPCDTPLHTRWFDLTDPIRERLFPYTGDLLLRLKRSQRHRRENEAKENRER